MAEEIELDDEDEAILDRVWDRIGAQRRGEIPPDEPADDDEWDDEDEDTGPAADDDDGGDG